MTEEELKQRFPRISDDCIRKTLAQDEAQRLNPRLYGPAAHKRAVENAEAEKAACNERVDQLAESVAKQNAIHALDNQPKDRTRRQGRVAIIVTITSYRRAELDFDNLVSGLKSLRDAIASSLALDDADKRLRWEYSQVVTTGITGTHVLITMV